MTPYLARRSYFTPPSNLPDLLLRDVASLLLTTELISSSLVALRPECNFSPELTRQLNSMVTLCDEGEARVQQPLLEASIALPSTADTAASNLITDFFRRLPSADERSVFASEVIINLQLLAQHVELKARLAGEEAAIVGLDGLKLALEQWAADWRACRKKIGTLRATVAAPARDSANLGFALPQGI